MPNPMKPAAQASESGGEAHSQMAIGNDADAVRALRNLMAPFGGYIKKHAPALFTDMEAALSAPQAAPVAWERETANGWVTVAPEDLDHYRGKGQRIRALGVIQEDRG